MTRRLPTVSTDALALGPRLPLSKLKSCLRLAGRRDVRSESIWHERMSYGLAAILLLPKSRKSRSSGRPRPSSLNRSLDS
jgi:hypothetical protein